MKQATHVASTRGNWAGHLFRRLVHVSIAVIPFIYYAYAGKVADFFGTRPAFLLFSLLLLVAILEGLRLIFGWVLFGQRQYEKRKLSALAWTVFSLVLVLYFSPAREYSIAIILGCAVGDPLLGELRYFVRQQWLAAVSGWLIVTALWLGCAYYFDFDSWLALLLATLTVVVERANIRWLDDNALMLLTPLFIIMALQGESL